MISLAYPLISQYEFNFSNIKSIKIKTCILRQ
jgi:hypothetical protein